jgi:UDP-N-acetylglucosamine acyltransferase
VPHIDPRAVVSPRARLAADVTVGAYAIVGDDVEIGAGSTVAPHAMVSGPATLGRDNQVWQFASIGGAPQDRKYRREPTRLEIGDRNVFRECCTINRGTVGGHGVTRIGDDCLFMAYSHVAHDCVVGSQVIMSNCTALAGHVEVDDWVIFSGYAAVHQFCKIGAHAFLANNAAVTRDVPPYLMVAGSPAEPVAINAEGLKRRGFTPQQIANLRHAYRVLYRSGLKLAQAAEELARLAAAQPEVQAFVDFLPRVTRSLIR